MEPEPPFFAGAGAMKKGAAPAPTHFPALTCVKRTEINKSTKWGLKNLAVFHGMKNLSDLAVIAD